jgi:hypothetical protein
MGLRIAVDQQQRRAVPTVAKPDRSCAGLELIELKAVKEHPGRALRHRP